MKRIQKDDEATNTPELRLPTPSHIDLVHPCRVQHHPKRHQHNFVLEGRRRWSQPFNQLKLEGVHCSPAHQANVVVTVFDFMDILVCSHVYISVSMYKSKNL